MILTSVLLIMCADAHADSSRIRTDRQHVADLDREVQGLAHVGKATKGTEHARDRAVDRWLRDELAELRDDASDAAIVQARAIAAVARERHRDDVAHEVDTAISTMIERRVLEIAPRIAVGEWHAALAQLAAWVRPDDNDLRPRQRSRARRGVLSRARRLAAFPQ